MNKRLRNSQFVSWCVPLIGVSLFSLVAVIPFKIGRTSVPNAMLEEWRFYPEAAQLEIILSAASQPRYFYLAQPPRIIVDVPNTNMGYVPTKQNYSGAIQSIRVSQLKPGVTRLVMNLAPGTILNPNQLQLQPISIENPTRWVLRPLNAGERSYSPSEFSPQPNSLPSINTAPQQPSNQPQGMYNLPQLQPSNQPRGMYNPSPPPSLSVPPETNLPANTYNSPQIPFVSVPPLTPNNPSQFLPNSILPPPTFPNQSGNLNLPPVISPDYPTPNIPNSR